MTYKTEEQKRFESILGLYTEDDNFELPSTTISGIYIVNSANFTTEKRKELNSISQVKMNELFVFAVHYNRIEEIDFLCQKNNKVMPDVHCVKDVAFKIAAKNNLNTLDHLLKNYISPSTLAINLFLEEENFPNKERVVDLVKYYNEKNNITINPKELSEKITRKNKIN